MSSLKNIESYIPLLKISAVKILHKLPDWITIDDAANMGWIGLSEAYKKWDSTTDTKMTFESYASIYIRNRILDQARNLYWASRVSYKASVEKGETTKRIKNYSDSIIDSETSIHDYVGSSDFYSKEVNPHVVSYGDEHEIDLIDLFDYLTEGLSKRHIDWCRRIYLEGETRETIALEEGFHPSRITQILQDHVKPVISSRLDRMDLTTTLPEGFLYRLIPEAPAEPAGKIINEDDVENINFPTCELLAFSNDSLILC